MHILQRQIPYFFDTPTPSDARRCIRSSLLLAVIAISWISLGALFERGGYYFFPITFLLLHGYYIIRHARNMLYLLRYALLSVIGLGASAAWVFHSDVLIAPFGAQYQTHESTIALVGSVMLAVAGSTIGWSIPFRKKKLPLPLQILRAPIEGKLYSRISIVLCGTLSMLLVYRAGGIVTEYKVYAVDTIDLGFEFGAFNAILFFWISIYLIYSRLIDASPFRTMLVSIAIFIPPILTGARADFLIQIVFISYMLFMSRRAEYFSKRAYPVTLIIVGIIFLYFSAITLGIWRQSGEIGETIVAIFSERGIFKERSSGIVLDLSTANQMAGHFYAVFAKLSFIGEPFLWGRSYFEFIPRSLPGFLGIERPQDLALQMDIAGQIMAQGGIFEVAEAYWNLWYFGAFVIPLLISYFMASLLRRTLLNRTDWFFGGAAFTALMLMSPRAVWYQTFAYWRVWTIILIFYAAHRVFLGKRVYNFRQKARIILGHRSS